MSETRIGALRALTHWVANADLRVGLLVGVNSDWETPATARGLEYVNEIAADIHDDDPRVAISVDDVTIDVGNNRAVLHIDPINFTNLDPELFAGVTIGAESGALSGPPGMFAATDVGKVIAIPDASAGDDPWYTEITAFTDDENVTVTPATPEGGGAASVDAVQSVMGFFLYEHLGADDSANPLVKFYDAQVGDLSTALYPNGATLIVSQGTDGLFRYNLIVGI